LIRVSLVDEVGGSIAYLYDGVHLMDERDWQRAAPVDGELKSQLDALLEELGG